MPRYFFHVFDDLEVRDDEGVELRNLEAVRAYAALAARHLVSDSLQAGGRINPDHRIDVEDEEGRVVVTVPFGDVNIGN